MGDAVKLMAGEEVKAYKIHVRVLLSEEMEC